MSKKLRWPGIEPGSTAWKAAMLTIIPPTLYIKLAFIFEQNVHLLKRLINFC